MDRIIKLHDVIFGVDGETVWNEKYAKVVWYPDTISTSLRGISIRQSQKEFEEKVRSRILH